MAATPTVTAAMRLRVTTVTTNTGTMAMNPGFSGGSARRPWGASSSLESSAARNEHQQCREHGGQGEIEPQRASAAERLAEQPAGNVGHRPGGIRGQVQSVHPGRMSGAAPGEMAGGDDESLVGELRADKEINSAPVFDRALA